MSLNDKQLAEINFWQNLVKEEGREVFLRRRKADFYRHMNNFNGWCDLNGDGLEVGSGCYSMFDAANLDKGHLWVEKIDPLAKEFEEILDMAGIPYGAKVMVMDGEDLEMLDHSYDWIVCWNVIDHTPHPELMVSEMSRVLKPRGKIYLEVNFDDKIANPHYLLWDESTVEKHFSNFTKLYENKIRNEPDKQYLYYAVFEK